MQFKTFSLFFVLSTCALAQPFSAGLKIGAPLTDAISITSNPTFAAVTQDTHRLVIGPYLELRLPFHFSIEGDALYRSYEYQLAPGTAGNSVGQWEFPIMAKRRLFGGPIQPYIEGGLVFSHLTGGHNVTELQHETNYGITLGAGVEIHALLVRISPEIRYDGFAFRNFNSASDVIQSNRNQVMFMVGIGF